MDVTTEIRKLPPSNIRELSQILELNDSWKRLMALIPKILEKNVYECNITMNNLHKYHSEHFKIIENAADRFRSCTEILFDEWGTSGRVRPALGHLLYLLTKAELFRAADYVAENILHIDRPPRPSDGPAALVTTTLLDSEPNMQHIEEVLNDMNYSSSVLSNVMENHSVDVNIYVDSSVEDEPIKVIPQIVVSSVPTTSVPFGIPLIIQGRRNSLTIQNDSSEENYTETDVSDMIKFSQLDVANTTDDCSGVVPNISTLMAGDLNSDIILELNSSSTLNSDSIDYVPNISNLMNNGIITENSNLIQFSGTLTNVTNDTSNFNIDIPDVSALNITFKSVISESNQNVPAFSNLLTSSMDVNEDNTSIPQISILNSESESNFQDLPQISALLSENIQNKISTSKQFLPIGLDGFNDTVSEISSFTSKKSNTSSEGSQNLRRNCVSPLPNLSLNTQLPHFTYEELQISTNGFDETPHKNCRQVENPLTVRNGRFLGCGAFGSVFLALNLIDKPVAVKKLFLKDVDVVNVDDTITKQFRNEVEVLSKYKHENLLSLVGYSCDGPTYCLLYEFIPGGALKDRLQIQDKEEILQWNDRLSIAHGTANAIAYLHTAYSTPLIHRDIKTANILLDCSKRPKLCDFGLIKLIPNQNTNTSTSAFGTSAYMAREAFRGDVSVKLDTFSYGVVLLELITGLPPLDENREGYDIVTHVDEICEDTGIIPLIDECAGSWIANDVNFAVELYNISIKCLEENKRKRPTMVEVTELLTELNKSLL